MSRKSLRAVIVTFISLFGAAQATQGQDDSTMELRATLRRANGSTARLERGRVYSVLEKIELRSLCPDGVTIEGNGATIRALPAFRHGALLTSTELLRDDPYDAGVKIRNLTLDGAGHVGRCVFGNWKNARIHDLRVEGGTIYQMNALWSDSMLSNLRIVGNASQTNNGFDCNLRHSHIWNASVDMQGNPNESAFWLNGCENATIVNLYLKDGRTAFGLEDCKDVNLLNARIRGRYTFRVVNILPAEASERIHLYDLDLEAEHVGDDASAGVHFNATRGGMVVRGTIRVSGPGVMLSNGASDVDVLGVDLPERTLHPATGWTQLGRRNIWISRLRENAAKRSNKPPVVYAGPDRSVRKSKDILLAAAVADEQALTSLNVHWSKVNGPGRVVFRNATKPSSRVSFSKPGTYELRLAADDGEFRVEDEATIKILPKPTRRSSNRE